MASSAINSQIWNAKAANVQNADGSPIYSAGIWTFKSSTNVTTFSVSDAGVVNSPLGSYHGTALLGVTLKTEANSKAGIRLGAGGAAGAKDYGFYPSFGAYGDFHLRAGTSLNSDPYSSGVSVMSCASAGAWTLGPASGLTTFHRLQNSANAATTVLDILKYTDGDTVSNYYITFGTNTTGQGSIWNNASGDLAIQTASDISLKENIREFAGGLSAVNLLKPKMYDWKSGAAKDCVGFIAQDYEEVFPRSVSEQDGIKSIGFGPEFQATLVKAVQELSALVTAQQAQIDALSLLIKGA